MNITIQIIPDSEQRYPFTGADWFFDEFGNLNVRVSKMSDPRYETLLALHEMVEAILCKHNGVSQQSVDEYDAEFDRTHASDVNAGDEPDAPYRREHCLATALERVVCAELGVNWKEYDDELGRFPSRQTKDLSTGPKPGYGTGQSGKDE